MTPSPSPSPNNKLNLKTLPVKFHPYKNLGRARKPGGPHAPRVVSLRTYTPSRPGQLPGQATMRFDNPTPPSSQTGEHLPGEGETPTDEYMDQEEDERDPKDRDVG
ncbi:hypothetical protein PLICRDRAFT_140545 [Plicaturopsis crispa FD-325 SS-3]|nr:hypothetical protein PLICRDRAFT_140545 [Plicaturopsis crispa FD-325 SS-3]